MKMFIVCLALTFLVMPFCWAQSAHEMSVGGQTEQICTPALIATIETYLDLPAQAPDPGSDNTADSVLVAAACKVNPANREQTFVAVAYDAGEQYEKSLILAMVDNRTHQVVADYRGRIDEDAATRVDSGSLWIDTAAYLLAPGVRAFGLDMTSGYMPNCGDGGTGAERSLYVLEGKHIRRVLDGLTMSSWQFVQRGADRCNSEAPADTPSIIERAEVSLSVAKQSSHGYHDLQADVGFHRDDSKKQNKPSVHYTLHYDGKDYRVPSDLGLF